MINHIDNILKILKNTKPPEAESKQQQVTYLVQRENNMETILWQLYEAQFMPQIRYQAGNIAWMCIEVNEHKFIIKNPNISHASTG